MKIAESQASFPTFTQADLQDPSLSRLNTGLQFLASQIAYLQGGTGPITLKNVITAPGYLAEDDGVPTNPDSLLTLGAAQTLFGSSKQLSSGALTSNPIPPGGGGSGGGSFTSITRQAGRIIPNVASRILGDKLGDRLSIFDFGAVGDGVTDDTVAFNNALLAADALGGLEIYMPGGYTYFIDGFVNFAAGRNPVMLSGDGESSVIKSGVNVPTGKGLLDIPGSDVILKEFLIEGSVTTPAGLLYSTFSSDPMSPLLTTNSSVWIHPGASRVCVSKVTIQHTGGYSILIDSETADVTDIEVLDCWFVNNRPNLFGTSSGDLTYGSWTGGVLWRGNCQAGHLFAVRGLLVQGCHWRRCTGNALWGHSEGFATQHTNINLNNNDFQDLGLDGILFGNVDGGGARGNTLHRVGYVTLTDSDVPNPKYLAGLFATAIDGGFSHNAEYVSNAILSVNGNFMDTDGHYRFNLSGNVMEQPISGSPQYTEDRISLFGPMQNGVNLSVGINVGNSQQLGGAQFMNLVNNTIINMGISAIVLGFGKYSRIADNVILHESAASSAPIQIFSASGGTSDEWLCHDDIVETNTIWYNGSHAAIEETGAGWVSGSVNRVFDNTVIGAPTGGEFLKAAASGSYLGFSIAASSWKDSGIGAIVTISGTGIGNAALSVVLGYVSSDGGFTTSSANFNAIQASSGGVTAKLLIATTSISATADTAAHAGLSTAGNGRIYFDSVSNTFLVSQNGAAYVPLVGSGGAVAGSDMYVQYNKASAFGADSNLQWNYNTQVLTITGIDATAAIAVTSPLHTAYIQSDGGFTTAAVASNAIQAPNGGVTALSLISVRNDGAIGVAISRTSTTARTYGFGVDSSGDLFLEDFTASVNRMTVTTVGLFTFGTSVQIDQSGNLSASAVIQATGAIGSGSGFNVPTNTSFNVFQAAVGGMSAKSFTAANYVQVGHQMGNPSATAGDTIVQGALAWNDTVPALQVYTGSAWATLGSVAGSPTWIQYNGAGAFAASTNLTWDNTNQVLTAGSAISTAGVATNGTSTAALNAPNGGVTCKFLIGTVSFSLTGTSSATAGLSNSGQGRIYFDSSTNIFMVSQNTGSYVPLLGTPAWTTFTPAISGAVSTVTIVSGPECAYVVFGKTVFFRFQARLSFSANEFIVTIALPVTPISVGGSQFYQSMAAWADIAGGSIKECNMNSTGSSLEIVANTSFVGSTNIYFWVQGVYESA